MSAYPKGFLYGPSYIVHETDLGKRFYKPPKYEKNINILPAEAPSNYLPVLPESDNNVDNLFVDNDVVPPIDVLNQTLTAYFAHQRLQSDLDRAQTNADNISLEIKPSMMFDSIVRDEFKRRAGITMNMYDNAGLTPVQQQEKFLEETLKSVRNNPNAIRQNDPAIINALKLALITRGAIVPASIDTLAPTNYERGTSELMSSTRPIADLGDDMGAMSASRIPLDLPGTTIGLSTYSRGGEALASASAGDFPGLEASETGLTARLTGGAGERFGAPKSFSSGAMPTTLEDEIDEETETSNTGGTSLAPSARGRKVGSISTSPSANFYRLVIYAFSLNEIDVQKMDKRELGDIFNQLQEMNLPRFQEFAIDIQKILDEKTFPSSALKVAEFSAAIDVFNRYRYSKIQITES